MRVRSIALALAFLAIAVVAMSGPQVRAQRPEPSEGQSRGPQDKASVWMQQKLVASQKILEGMTRGDYEMIGKNARAMQVMGYLERWVRADIPGYKAQLQAFEYANDAIVRSAKNRNLDGVTLAYTQLAISCTQCHKIVREESK